VSTAYDVFQQYLDSRISLTPEESERIRSVHVLKRLRKKQYLLQEGDVWKYNAFVARGCLRTYSVDEKGLEHIVGFAIENWWAGDRQSLLAGVAAQFNIDAIEDSEIVLFTDANFQLLRKEIRGFDEMVTTLLDRSLAASQHRIHAAISFTAEEKYLNFLSKYPGLAARVPQSMIASYLGMTPETLSRIRSQVSKK